MGKRIALIFAAAVAIGTGPAIAADLLPPPPPVEAPFLPGGDFSGWYLRGDVGVGWTQLNDMRSTFAPGSVVPGFQIDRAKLDDSFLIGGGVGYQWNSWVRFDVTGEYRSHHNFTATESYLQHLRHRWLRPTLLRHLSRVRRGSSARTLFAGAE
jgi:opacity protein-like surface antigen